MFSIFSENSGCKLAEYKVDEQQAVNKLHTVGKLKREIQLVSVFL